MHKIYAFNELNTKSHWGTVCAHNESNGNGSIGLFLAKIAKALWNGRAITFGDSRDDGDTSLTTNLRRRRWRWRWCQWRGVLYRRKRLVELCQCSSERRDLFVCTSRPSVLGPGPGRSLMGSVSPTTKTGKRIDHSSTKTGVTGARYHVAYKTNTMR